MTDACREWMPSLFMAPEQDSPLPSSCHISGQPLEAMDCKSPFADSGEDCADSHVEVPKTAKQSPSNEGSCSGENHWLLRHADEMLTQKELCPTLCFAQETVNRNKAVLVQRARRLAFRDGSWGTPPTQGSTRGSAGTPSAASGWLSYGTARCTSRS